MSTDIRPEVSKKNRYWIDRHRYYELKHFCLQYPIWKKSYTSLDSMVRFANDISNSSKTNKTQRPVEDCVIAREYFYDRIKMVEDAAKETDDVLGTYILKAVTEGLSYDCLRAKYNVPCCKDTYYNLYRRFFWLLSKTRQ
ncbi:MAG: hypothetical protein LUD27_02840 [Clostridia bacterium]|nr:hypothetical protein [Clostridia bacterium]